MAEESGALGGAASFIGSSVGEAAAFAAGLAIGPLLRPILQALENETWSQYPDKPLDPQTMALAVAQGRIDAATGQSEAGLTGIGPTAFQNLVTFAYEYPDAAVLLELSRRGLLAPANLVPALQRGGLTAEYAGYVAQLVDARLSPQQVALGIVRGLITDPGLMPVNLDTSGGNVPAYPVSALDALTEAEDAGIDEDRLRVMVGSIGLPMSTQQAASAFFRGIITQGDFNRSILEGDVRPEWAASILEQSRQILTAHDYVELHLRGWIDQPTMYAGTAKHGMSQADTDLFFEVLGRPLAVHQVTTGLARGGTYNGSTADIPADYLAAIKESNIRPEYYALAYANRYSFPTGFQIKAEATGGNLTTEQTNTLLLELGWDPTWATFFSEKWVPTGAGAKGSPYVTKAQTQLWTATHKAFIAGSIDQPTASAALSVLGIDTADLAVIFELWDEEANIGGRAAAPPA